MGPVFCSGQARSRLPRGGRKGRQVAANQRPAGAGPAVAAVRRGIGQ